MKNLMALLIVILTSLNCCYATNVYILKNGEHSALHHITVTYKNFTDEQLKTFTLQNITNIKNNDSGVTVEGGGNVYDEFGIGTDLASSFAMFIGDIYVRESSILTGSDSGFSLVATPGSIITCYNSAGNEIKTILVKDSEHFQSENV